MRANGTNKPCNKLKTLLVWILVYALNLEHVKVKRTLSII